MPPNLGHREHLRGYGRRVTDEVGAMPLRRPGSPEGRSRGTQLDGARPHRIVQAHAVGANDGLEQLLHSIRRTDREFSLGIGYLGHEAARMDRHLPGRERREICCQSPKRPASTRASGADPRSRAPDDKTTRRLAPVPVPRTACFLRGAELECVSCSVCGVCQLDARCSLVVTRFRNDLA